MGGLKLRDIPPTVLDRVAFEPNTGCWLWTGALSPDGYGKYPLVRPERRAHRAIWVLANGPIPPGLVIRHACDGPICVNLDHLLLGTVLDNTHDRVRRGRAVYRYGEEHHYAKLTTEQVLAILRDYATDQYSQRALAARYGVEQTTISKITRGVTWPHLTRER